MVLVSLVPSLESAALSPLPGSHFQLPVPPDPVTSAWEGSACTPGAGAADLRVCNTLPHGWNAQQASSAICSDAVTAAVWGLFLLPVPGALGTLLPLPGVQGYAEVWLP